MVYTLRDLASHSDASSRRNVRLALSRVFQMIPSRSRSSLTPNDIRRRRPLASGSLRGYRFLARSPGSRLSGYFLLGSSAGFTYVTPQGPTPCTWITVSSFVCTK